MSPRLALLVLAARLALAQIPYAEYILAPASRTLHPVSVHTVNGTATGAESVTGDQPGSLTFTDVSAVTFDYSKNIAGIVSLEIGAVSDPEQYIGLTYSESSLWISSEGSDAMGDTPKDLTLWFQPKEAGTYTLGPEHERGAFKYLTLVHNTTGSLEVKSVTTHFTAMPHWPDDGLQAYTGYFHSEDELLNRIWYAGAYTNQLCTIDPTHGNSVVNMPAGDVAWYLNSTISAGTSVLTDGAKRDRLVWSGDMSIAVPGIATTTNDLVSIRNALDSLFAVQDKTTGQLPYAGTPLPMILSHTYHLYALIGVASHYLYSGDIEYLQKHWDETKLAMKFILTFMDDSGMMNVTSPNDWLRGGMYGHNIEANGILYYTLNEVSALATALNDTAPLEEWSQTASGIKAAANSLLWDAATGLYRDNDEGSTLYPQDGNSWAIVSNLTLDSSQSATISSNLVKRWGTYGAPAPEASDAISPFIGGFELQAHALAGNSSAALELMRLQWGFMLNDPRMTNSTFIEGYSTSGSLHYAPYANDPRVSHAHGWATGPTSTLTFLIAGIQLKSPGGKTWAIAPRLAELKEVKAGFKAGLGTFAVDVGKADANSYRLDFETPQETSGKVTLEAPGCSGTFTLQQDGAASREVTFTKTDDAAQIADLGDVGGGRWLVEFKCAA